MKIFEVEINTHDSVDANYSVKNGRRYMFVTKELAAEFVFKNMKAQYFLGGGNIVATRQMLLDNVDDSSWYSIRQYIKAEPNEPGDCFDLLGYEPEDETQYYHVIEREVFEAGFYHKKNIDNMEKDQIIYDKRKVMGENIRRLRTAQGWEQEQLAQIVGITTSNVRSVEAGKYAVNIDVLNKIAGALGAELRMIENKK